MTPDPVPSTLDADRRRFVGRLALAALLPALPGCGGGEAGSTGSGAATAAATDSAAMAEAAVDPAAAGADAVATLAHPGLMHTEADFERMRTKVAAGAQPWLDGYNALKGSGRASVGASPNPLATVVRGGTGENFRTMVEDLERAYQFALRWKVSGDTAYADRAVLFLDAWSSTLTLLDGNADRFLAAGIYGYQWANAAEIMRTYDGWPAENVARFQQLLLTVFYPLSHTFLVTHNGSEITNYWANWDLCNIAAVLAIGVFCDRRDLVDEALDYYRNGSGNGAAAHNVYVLHPGHMGQWQESGRDQGHSTLGISLAGAVCEMAWNQGIDLYGHANNRFLAGAEYVAKSNLADAGGAYAEQPFSKYVNRQGTFTAVSAAGRPNWRPGWEAIHHHYVNRRGLAAPYVAAMAAKMRPESNQWNGDQLCFGTLAFTRDPIAEGAPPSGLTAVLNAGAVLLSWWGSAYADQYVVKRAASADGPFTAIASATDPRTCTDTPPGGTWFYAVAAVTGGAEGAPSSPVRVVVPGEVRVQLPLNDGSGSVAADVSGLGQSGTLVGSATWAAGRNGGMALQLDGQSGHVALPAGVLSTLGDCTISVWVYWRASATNTRVFDFGSSDIASLFLIPRDGAGRMRVSVTGTRYWGEQTVSAASALPTGRWVHLAFTLSGTVGILYVDGVEAGRNEAITFAPFQLGETTRNWLGRSQYGADPYFNGLLQDLQIRSGALSAAEIAATSR